MTLPLEDINILDMTRLAPGPYCTMILADLGADVLKIEEPGGPVGRRAEQGQGAADMPNLLDRHSPYNALNRNKRSIALNLKADEARQIFYRLVGKADVVVEEFRPGVAKRLGVDYETLRKLNPRLIYCSITGYGQDGPYNQLVGHDINYISTAGALGIIGEKDGAPVIPHNLLGDFAGGGMHGAIGILTALVAREKTGRGQAVDISMTDGVVSLMAQFLSTHFATKEVPPRGDTYLSGAAPHYNVYKTKDGKYLSLGSLEPWFYANLCRAIGREDFIPYANDEGQKRQEILSYFREHFLTKTRDEWFDYLRQWDICVSRVLTVDELASDPQIVARQMIVEVDDPRAGKVKQAGILVKLSETPGSIRSLSPASGQHTDEVLQGLGYAREEIDRLRGAGAIR